MANVFTYGSLMFSDVLFAVTGARLRSESATLSGYRVSAVKGRSYPALLRLPTSVANGRLYRGVSAAAFERLDAFEGASYVRRRIRVRTDPGHATAFVYVWHPAERKRVAAADWDAHAFDQYQRRPFAAYWRRRRRRGAVRCYSPSC